MAAKNLNVRIIDIHDDGTQFNINPFTKSDNVSVTPSNNIPETVSNVQEVFSSLGKLAFDDGDNFVYIGSTEDEDSLERVSEIDDEQVSLALTWSSNKIETKLNELLALIANCYTKEEIDTKLKSIPTMTEAGSDDEYTAASADAGEEVLS